MLTASVATSATNGTAVLDVFAPDRPRREPGQASLVTATPDLALLFQEGLVQMKERPAASRHRRRAGEVSVGSVSELCQMPPETLARHRDVRGHSDAHECCGK
jgi:hypothetical protein